MKKKNQNLEKTISSNLLSAIREKIFSNEGGIDISPIARDLANSSVRRDEDATAIALALLLKGYKPNFEEDLVRYQVNERASTYKFDSQISYAKYEFVGYSLIDDIVRAKKILFYAEKNKDLSAESGIPTYGDWSNEGKVCEEVTFTFGSWMSMDIDDVDIKAECRKWE